MKTAQGKLRLGLIGCGRVAEERHLPALKLLPQVRLVAVADTEATRIAALGDRYGIAKQYTHYQELIDDADVEAVGILTPTGSHAEIGAAVLTAGKHLFLEKPLALNLEECERLVTQARTATVKSLLCFNLRWHRLVQQARCFLATGALGKIIAIRSEYTHARDGSKAPDWHRILAKGGGVTFNEAVHHVDLWRYFLGAEVTEVFAFHNADEHYEDVSSMMCACLNNGALGTAFNTFRTSPNSEIEILGEGGRLCLNLYRFDGMEFIPTHQYPGNVTARVKRLPGTVKGFVEALRLKKRGGDFQATFYSIWRHFADCVLNDARPEVSLEDGLRAMQITQAAIQSFQTNERVCIDA